MCLENALRFRPESVEVIVAVDDDSVGVLEQGFGKTDHLLRLGIAQVSNVQVSEPDPVQAVGILQQRRQAPVWMRTMQLLRQAVMDDGGVDQQVIVVAHSCPRKERAEMWKRFELLHGVTAVAVADAIVGAGDVVEIHSGPQARRLFDPSRRFDESERVHEHTSDVRLAVKRARVREERGWRCQIGERKVQWRLHQ